METLTGQIFLFHIISLCISQVGCLAYFFGFDLIYTFFTYSWLIFAQIQAIMETIQGIFIFSSLKPGFSSPVCLLQKFIHRKRTPHWLFSFIDGIISNKKITRGHYGKRSKNGGAHRRGQRIGEVRQVHIRRDIKSRHTRRTSASTATGRARQFASWKAVLLNYSITPIQQYSYTTGKNSTDAALIIDAMDILYSDNVDGFCIVSSDSDFTRLAARLRESGMYLIGMGEKKTPTRVHRGLRGIQISGGPSHPRLPTGTRPRKTTTTKRPNTVRRIARS